MTPPSSPLTMPLITERLVIRQPRPDDAADLAARRSDASVAEFQSWTVPFSLEQASEVLAEVEEMSGPEDGRWWMLVITDASTGATLGDLAVRLFWDGRAAEVGFTLGREHWGNGFAVEALAALVAGLFEQVGVSRIEGRIHPDNIVSAQVLERTGFLHEGRTKLSYWVGDDNTDDDLYGLTRQDWDSWRTRPTAPPDDVRLVDVSVANDRALRQLVTHASQRRFVSPVLNSFADALVPEHIDGHPVVPWLRAVAADEELVAFVMLALTTEHHPEPYLWRLLVDRRHQRRSIGRRALELVVGECRAMGDSTLLTSWVGGRGSPDRFYQALGFEPTGAVIDGEIEGRLRFDAAP